jgi:non-lysosomal glucosylceramidase
MANLRGSYPGQPRYAGGPLPYTDEELFGSGPQRPLRGPHLRQVAFPLGGIGTGCVSFSGSGQLVDWELFGRPNKGYRPDYSFFHLYAQEQGEPAVYRVLEGRLQPPYEGWSHGSQVFRGMGFGPPLQFGSGLAHMAECSFTGYFPFCRVDLADPRVPVRVSTEAWSPFIPLNDRDSSLPVAVFTVTLTNCSPRPVCTTVALGLQNVLGWPRIGQSTSHWVEGAGWHGIAMSTEKHAPDAPRYGTLALVTPDPEVTWQLRFASTQWFEAAESLVDEFGATGEFAGPREPHTSGDGEGEVAQLGLKAELAPGESVRRTFVMAWLMPNYEKYWGPADDRGQVWKTYHGRQWTDAEAVAQYTVQHLARLEQETRQFADAFFASTLPTHVLEAISSQMAILRTPTVTRLPDGTLYGWEGCHASEGCCEGSCTHVWSYVQTIAHLFPHLERQMRAMDYDLNLRPEDGHMQFRMALPPGTHSAHDFHAATDGQMGGVLRTYREWQLSGDDRWLSRLWPLVKRALEYAWKEWDRDQDGLLEGIHHNTLDIEFHGPETMCGSMYLAALRAGEEMARYLGDQASADHYRRVFESGRRLSDERLFNGEYYEQQVTPGDDAPYQFGPGCLCDQLLGQWHALQYGLGELYDPEHMRSALASVYRYNMRTDFYEQQNPHRVYALNGDKGLLICTWPHGGRPKRSMPYSFECQIGYEVPVGAHLLSLGYLREGLTICKAIRDRHDGLERNPYNEFECGSHYARSMANYSYLLALSGWRYAAPSRTMMLNPLIAADDFRCFFSVEGAWGVVGQRRTAEGGRIVTVQVLAGALRLERVVAGEDTLEVPGTRIAAGETWSCEC